MKFTFAALTNSSINSGSWDGALAAVAEKGGDDERVGEHEHATSSRLRTGHMDGAIYRSCTQTSQDFGKHNGEIDYSSDYHLTRWRVWARTPQVPATFLDQRGFNLGFSLSDFEFPFIFTDHVHQQGQKQGKTPRTHRNSS